MMNDTSPPPPPLLCCGPTPAVQRGLVFPDWEGDADVVRASDVSRSVGGKATNAARAVTRAGGGATVLGFAGGPNGDRMKDLLRREGLEGIWVDTATETRFCQTLMDREGRRIRELVEDAGPVSLHEWGELFAKAEQAIPFHAALLLCGSLPAEAPEGVYATLVELARNANRKVGIDAKGPELRAALKPGPDLVKINLDELRDATGETDPAVGIQQLLDLGVGAVMITDGPRPARVHDGERMTVLELPEIEPLNPIGGGDTVTGVTLHEWLRGGKLLDAALAGLGAGMAQTLTARPADFDPDTARELAGRIRKVKT